MSASLTKREIIKNKNIIKRLAKCAIGIKIDYMGVRFIPNAQQFHRIVIFVHRNVRGVMRNKLRRIGREVFRLSKNEIPPPYGDIALLVNISAIDVLHTERCKQFVYMACKVSERVRR